MVTIVTQIGVSSNNQLCFPVVHQFEVERSNSLLLELILLLVEEFTPETVQQQRSGHFTIRA